MLKVLVIDDEPVIREGLKTIIQWNDYGFCVCGEAANGEDGLEKINELKPDLIIVDMKMPGMGGLEMISRMRAGNIHTKAIILSGYSDFTYAQKALEYDVKCYLLKPIDRNLLVDKVKSTYDVIIKEKKEKEYLNRSIKLTRDKLFEELVSGQTDAYLTDNADDPYDFRFPWDYYQVILAEPGGKEEIREDARHEIYNRINDYATGRNIGLVFNIGNCTAILSKVRIYESNLKLLDPVVDIARDMAGLDITVAVGTGTKDMDGICGSYRNARKLLSKKFIYGSGSVIIEKRERLANGAEGRNNSEQLEIDEIINKLYIAIDVNNMSGINDLTEEMRSFFTDYDYSEDRIKTSYIRIYTGIINRLQANNTGLRDLSCNNDAVFHEIMGKKCLQKLHGYVKYRLVSISDELAKIRPDRTMDKILDYICRNCSEDIKLESLAAVFNYNSAYLGQLFKNHTGRYFHTYLDEVRIDKAKQLLKEGLKVCQVAGMVGYDNVGYFHNKFKKYTGTQPAVYKSSQNL